MSVTVRDNTAAVLQDIKQRSSLALRFMVEDIDRISTPNTPKDTGDLRNRKLKQVLGLTAKIEWQTNYAAVQELKQHRNYTTPGTGPHFAENAVRMAMGQAQKYFRQAGIGK